MNRKKKFLWHCDLTDEVGDRLRMEDCGEAQGDLSAWNKLGRFQFYLFIRNPTIQRIWLVV